MQLNKKKEELPLKRLLQKVFIFLLICGLFLIAIFPTFAAGDGGTTHTVNITWLFDPNMSAGTQPPFEGTTTIGSISFTAEEGKVVDVSDFLYNPAGASYWQPGFINYNGMPCFPEFTYGEGGRGINSAGEPVDGLPFYFDPFGELTMPGTDVDLYYLYAPYYEYQDSEHHLDKIVIYVNRPNKDINPVKQQYTAYEIFHVSKSPDVQEDVTNDYTVGQEIMPDNVGFAYWITEEDPWFEVIQNSPYFDVIETSDPNYYNVILKPTYPNTESTAIEIAKYLENNIPENAEPKIVTADTPSYDNDSGYYLIISDINSNLILGTTNIAITEKAEYPTIKKTVNDDQVKIGQIVTFTVTTHFPEGSKAESIITDTMSEGLTYVEDSINVSIDSYNFNTQENGWVVTIPKEVITETFKNSEGDITITYQAIINEKAIIGDTAENVNNARLDFSHFSCKDSVNLYLTNFTLLKYDKKDESKKPLAGAEFSLLDSNKNVISLVPIEEGKTYRLATSTDFNSVQNFTTSNSEILINGIAADETYYLKENKAPSGYNLLPSEVEIKEVNYIEISNTSGGVLPSTGGRGTTIFIAAGGGLVIFAIILLIIKRRTNHR